MAHLFWGFPRHRRSVSKQCLRKHYLAVITLLVLWGCFFNLRDLKDVHSRVEKVLGHRKFRRIIDASSDTELIVTMFRQIKFSIEQLTVRCIYN